MKKGFTIYSIYTGLEGDGADHFATLADAKVKAKQLLRDYDTIDELEIEKHETVLMTKDNLIDILNSSGGSWARESAVVHVMRRRKGKVEADDE